MSVNVQKVADAVAQGVRSAANHSARAASHANGISAAAQSAQGTFNQNSANNANAIGTERMLQQYQFNAAQAAAANQFTSDMWDRSAAWNEMMWERQAAWNEKMYKLQMDFNANEAQKNRDWSTQMENTRYQRAMEDMQKAGLNPILAYGGIATGAGSGGAASVGGASIGTASMSGAQGAQASGGLVNGLSASEGNYSGQMEYLSGMLGLFGAAMDGISTAASAMSQMGEDNILTKIAEAFGTVLDPKSWDRKNPDAPINNPNTKYNQWKRKVQETIPKNMR